MVGATHAEEDLPEWVDHFRQWHFEMLSILDADELDRVHNRQAWIHLRPVSRHNLPTSFEVPLTPFLIPVPPAALDFLSSFSLTLVDNVYGDSSTPPTWYDLPPSANTRGSQPSTRQFGKSFCSLIVRSTSDSISF